MMPLGLWIVVGWMLFIDAIAVGFIVWGIQTNQFRDIEEAKYRMLEDHEPQGWPGREGGQE